MQIKRIRKRLQVIFLLLYIQSWNRFVVAMNGNLQQNNNNNDDFNYMLGKLRNNWQSPIMYLQKRGYIPLKEPGQPFSFKFGVGGQGNQMATSIGDANKASTSFQFTSLDNRLNNEASTSRPPIVNPKIYNLNPDNDLSLTSNLNVNPIASEVDLNSALNQPPELKTQHKQVKVERTNPNFLHNVKEKFLGLFRGKSTNKLQKSSLYNYDFHDFDEKNLEHNFLENTKPQQINHFSEQVDPEIEKIIEHGLKKDHEYDKEFLDTASKTLLAKLRQFS